MPSISIGDQPTQTSIPVPARLKNDNVDNAKSDNSSGINGAAIAIAIVVVLVFIGLFIGAIIVVRRRARFRQEKYVKRRVARSQLWTIDGEKGNTERPGDAIASQESLLLKKGVIGGAQTALSGVNSLAYAYDVDAAFPAMPPKAVTYTHKKKLRALASAFTTQAPGERTVSPRAERRSLASTMTEAWTPISLLSPISQSQDSVNYVSGTAASSSSPAYAHDTPISAQKPALTRQSSIRSQKTSVYRQRSGKSARSVREGLLAPSLPSLPEHESSQVLPLITLSPATPVARSSDI